MSQFDFGAIDTSTKTGTTLGQDLNSHRDALHSSHAGPTRPAYAQAGMVWTDDTGALEPYFYDGVSDISLLGSGSTPFPVNDANPSVAARTARFVTANTLATQIMSYAGMVAGQSFTVVIGDTDTVIDASLTRTGWTVNTVVGDTLEYYYDGVTLAQTGGTVGMGDNFIPHYMQVQRPGAGIPWDVSDETLVPTIDLSDPLAALAGTPIRGGAAAVQLHTSLEVNGANAAYFYLGPVGTLGAGPVVGFMHGVGRCVGSTFAIPSRLDTGYVTGVTGGLTGIAPKAEIELGINVFTGTSIAMTDHNLRVKGYWI